MNLGKLSLDAAVLTETFLNIVNELTVFDSMLKPIVVDTIKNNELCTKFSDRV